MSTTVAERLFIYIVESPAPSDLYDGRVESKTLASAFDLMEIRNITKLVANRATFEMALTTGIGRAIKDMNGAKPILHISTHGSRSLDGLVLTSGELVTWAELRRLLVPLNQLLVDSLMVSFSACFGFFAVETASQEGNLPYWLLTGPIAEVTWPESALWYATYYFNLIRTVDPTASGRAANAAIGNEGKFRYNLAKDARSLAIEEGEVK